MVICSGLGQCPQTEEQLGTAPGAKPSHITCATKMYSSAKKVHGTSGRILEKESGRYIAISPGHANIDHYQALLIDHLQVRNFEGAVAIVDAFLCNGKESAARLLNRIGFSSDQPLPLPPARSVQHNLIPSWMAGHDTCAILTIGQHLLQCCGDTFDIVANSAGAMAAAAVIEVINNWTENLDGERPTFQLATACILAAALPPDMCHANNRTTLTPVLWRHL